MVRIAFVTIGAFLAVTTGQLVAQQGAALREVYTLVNDANRQILEMQSAIEQTEARLSAWETSLSRASATRSARTVAPGRSEGELAALGREIANHPVTASASGGCRDDLQSVGQADYLNSALTRLPSINACAQSIAPRVRIDLPFECASLFWKVGTSGALNLSGHVQNPGDLDALRTRFGTALTKDVVTRPFPVCSALEALELPLTSQDKPSIRMLSGQSNILFDDSLAFEVVTPDFYAFFYLAYLQADGTVVNLLPRRGLMRPQHPPRTVLRFGDGREGRQTYTASAPAGTEAIIGIASRSPIDALENLEQGASGQYTMRGASGVRDVDQAVFLDLLNSSLDEEYEAGGGRREISAEVLHITVVQG